MDAPAQPTGATLITIPILTSGGSDGHTQGPALRAYTHTHAHRNKITTQRSHGWIFVCIAVFTCVCTCVDVCFFFFKKEEKKKGGVLEDVQHLSLVESSPLANLQCSLHANTHSNSYSVGCKIKTSSSLRKPCCFAYTALSYITEIIAVIMAPNSKNHLGGRGMIVAAGRRKESRSCC